MAKYIKSNIMYKLDLKDRKILDALDINARMPYSVLAKKVGLSQEVVRYRINRLVEENVISKFFTNINMAKLGFVFYKVLAKLHNINDEKKTEIIQCLRKNPFITWIGSIDGEYDLGFLVLVRDLFEFNALLTEFTNKYSEYILKKSICINLQGDFYPRDYLTGRQRSLENKQIAYTAKLNKTGVDKKDLEILSNLTENARMQVIEIASKIGLSADAVSDRIKRMEKEKIIILYNILLNNNVIGRMRYKVLVNLTRETTEKEKKLFAYCRMNPNIVYMIKTIGLWDVEIDLEVGSVEEFRKIMAGITNEFHDIIQDYSALLIYEVHKYNLLPKELIDAIEL